jgi:hypothetical protein
MSFSLKNIVKAVSAKRLVNTAIGTAAGYASGGFPGAMAGGATGALKSTNKKNTAGSMLTTGAIGFGTGALVGAVSGTGWAGGVVKSLTSTSAVPGAAPSPLNKSGGFLNTSVSFLSKGKTMLGGMFGGKGSAATDAGAAAENAVLVSDDGTAVLSDDQKKNRMYLYIGIAVVVLLILRK